MTIGSVGNYLWRLLLCISRAWQSDKTWSQSNPDPPGCSAALMQRVRTAKVHPTCTTDPTVPANSNSSEKTPLGNKIFSSAPLHNQAGNEPWTCTSQPRVCGTAASLLTSWLCPSVCPSLWLGCSWPVLLSAQDRSHSLHAVLHLEDRLERPCKSRQNQLLDHGRGQPPCVTGKYPRGGSL